MRSRRRRRERTPSRCAGEALREKRWPRVASRRRGVAEVAELALVAEAERKQKEAEAAKRKQAGSSASLAQLEDQSPPGSPGSSEQDSDEEGGSPKKTSASFRFKSPSRLFGASFRDKSKGKGD